MISPLTTSICTPSSRPPTVGERIKERDHDQNRALFLRRAAHRGVRRARCHSRLPFVANVSGAPARCSASVPTSKKSTSGLCGTGAKTDALIFVIQIASSSVARKSTLQFLGFELWLIINETGDVKGVRSC